MHQDINYTSIVLKKQPFNEADEIITFYTQEQGKIRALAKSIKLAKSKMQNTLQQFFAVQVVLSGRGNLKTISGTVLQHTYVAMRSNLVSIKCALVAGEIVLKFTPDGEKNVPVYEALTGFLEFLTTSAPAELGLIKFKLQFLKAIGLDPKFSQELRTQPALYELTETLEELSYLQLTAGLMSQQTIALQQWLSQFFLQNLEREIRSENFVV
jgi:DNA repair protein RecO (recombination protein O)